MTEVPVRPGLREAGSEDDPFLRSLFAATRPEFGVLPAELADAVVAHQYEVRERQYRDRFPTLVDHVIEIDGRPLGRVSTAEVDGGAVVVVVDIAVVPDARGNGIASSVLAHLLSEADGRGATVELSVATDSPAVRLYERLGFRPSGHAESTTHLRMRRSPV
jgi:GNAT superfamily N-acetyltransferase